MKEFGKIFANRTFYYHLSGWFVFFILHYLFFSSYEVKIDILFQLLFWVSNILIFYFNYLFLVPKLLFGKKIVYYFISLIASLVLFYFIISTFTDGMRERHKPANISQLPEFNRLPPQNSSEFKEFEKREGFQMPPKRGGNAMVIYNILFFFAASTAIKVVSKLEKEEKLKRDAETHKTLEELKLLKQQINPHFLFNSLNSIYSLANKKSERTIEAILKLSATLRYMLYDVNEPVVLLKNEIDHIHNFIELQKFRLTDVTNISLAISGDPDKYLIEPLLLIPFVENAFKFGTDNMQDSFINIVISVESGDLIFSTKNKIVNRNENNDNEKSKGIGLSNVRRRLEILYPGQHKLEITSKDNIFEVILNVKLKR